MVIFLFGFQVKIVRYFRPELFSQPNTYVENNISVLLTTADHIWMYQLISEPTIR